MGLKMKAAQKYPNEVFVIQWSVIIGSVCDENCIFFSIQTDIIFWGKVKHIDSDSKNVFSKVEYIDNSTKRWSSSFICSSRLRGNICGWGCGCAADAMPSADYGRNLEFGRGAGDSSPTLHKGHSGIFNIHQQMLADGIPV